MPLFNIVLTIHPANGPPFTYGRKQRAADVTRAKWSAIRQWAQRAENQAINLTRIDVIATDQNGQVIP